LLVPEILEPEFLKKISTVNCPQMRLLKPPLFKLFNLSESRISLNSFWVEVLKNLEHLGKLVLKEATLVNTHLNVKL